MSNSQILPAGEIWKNLKSIYDEMTARVDKDNPEALRERIAWVSRVIPFVALLRANAGYWLDDAIEKETRKLLDEEGVTPTILGKLLRGKVKNFNQVFELARKLHADLEIQSNGLRTLLSYEKSHMNNLDGGSQGRGVRHA